jgi:carboxyl-terminal processing protease
VALLVSQGTSGAASICGGARGQRSRGARRRTHARPRRAAPGQLPDGSGLLLSNVRYLTPKNNAIHERGLAPDVEVDEPEVDFGAEPPAGDATLDKAIESSSGKPVE